MRVKYTGPSDAQAIPLFPGEVVVERGGECEVPDDLGRLLVDQSIWEEVKRRPAKGRDVGETTGGDE